MDNHVFFGMGSNIGNCLDNLQLGIDYLIENSIDIVKISSVYKTAPVGYLDQPYFYNIVVEAYTDLSPKELLLCVKSIEKVMGRKKTVRFGPRNIDIDILIYNDLVLKTDELTIPHERMCERAFVLIPFNEIAGNVMHPVYMKTINELCNLIDCSGVQITDKIVRN